MASVSDIAEVALAERGWADPVEAAAAFADEPFVMLLASDGARGRWSYLLRRPEATLTIRPSDAGSGWDAAARLLGPAVGAADDGPPFQGGLAGLAAYELGARPEPSAPQARTAAWPDLAAGLYLGLLAFDHRQKRVVAVGRGANQAQARRRADDALAWLDAPATPGPVAALSAAFEPVQPDGAYERAVAAVVRAIADGEIFQANIARGWTGRLVGGVRPFDLLRRLARTSPAPFAAFFRLPGLALVSNSPERFLAVTADGQVSTSPIKGTRPRGRDPGEDAALASELLASAKDRAENLMIVDLMRNDLSRVCRPGSVAAGDLFALESFANVHHLVSTVTGRLAPGRTALDALAAAFPPGSITGAPKIQAMQVVARHEPPRGPYCGSLFWVGFDGAMDSSVLIRTVAFEQEVVGGWRFEARAGAGIVADSDPVLERLETTAKIAALRAALTGDGA